jgi:GGDEF domain-containing protein
MSTPYSQEIKEYLQHKDVQERILRSIEEARSKATVTISRAAKLFDFSESQLREWEKRGLLSTERQALSPEARGHRQYSPAELEKLAIIRELITNKYQPSDIPTDVDEIWRSLSHADGQYPLKARDGEGSYTGEADSMHIDQRILHIRDGAFWRFYVSHGLRLSLMLICEDITVKRAGLILPLHQEKIFASAPNSLENVSEVLIKDIGEVGESLVGWLGQSRSFYTFLTHKPSFEYPTDFRILQLKTKEEAAPCDNTLVVLPREDATLVTLSEPVVKIVRRLLTPLYDKNLNWQEYLGVGMRDILDSLIDFNSNTGLVDTILTGLAEAVVRLGNGKWRFCCILVPNNPQLPLQQRSLVIRAKSKGAPADYKVGTTLVSPEETILSISLRAFQGARTINRHRVTEKDTSIANHELEEPIDSAIAVPVGGEDGLPVAVLYVVSAEADAFSREDERVLRMIARMVEELLLSYGTRRQVTEKFANLIKNPSVADPFFGVFASENDFERDVEALLASIQKKQVEPIAKNEIEKQYATEEALSFIAIDIDNQTSLTNKYGDRLTKNLSRVIGEKIQTQLATLFTKPTKLYHIYGDRFYLHLNGISLKEARQKAELLKLALNGSYQLDALRPSIKSSSKSMLVSVDDVTVRLGVSSYTYAKIQDILSRYPSEIALAAPTAEIARALDEMLKLGQDKGGDALVCWEPELWCFISNT